MTLKIAANEKFKNTAVSVLRLPFQVACFFAWAFQDQWLSVGNKFFLCLFTLRIIYPALQLCHASAYNPATQFNSLIENFALFFNVCFSFGGNSRLITIEGYLLKTQSEIENIIYLPPPFILSMMGKGVFVSLRNCQWQSGVWVKGERNEIIFSFHFLFCFVLSFPPVTDQLMIRSILSLQAWVSLQVKVLQRQEIFGNHVTVTWKLQTGRIRRNHDTTRDRTIIDLTILNDHDLLAGSKWCVWRKRDKQITRLVICSTKFYPVFALRLTL